MMASMTTAYHLLRVTLLLSATIICLSINRATCFSPQRSWHTSQHCWRNNPCNNLHTSHHHSPSLDCYFTTTSTALSLSLQDPTADHQWTYHKSYNTKEDEDEIIHGRYTAVITKTTDLTNRWIGSFDPSTSLNTTTNTIVSQSAKTTTNDDISPPPPPMEALQAIQATHRWADNFVRQLHLCPWAGSSLDKAGAICYWALLVDEEDEERVVLNKMEEIVREAGVQLTLATSDDNEEDGEDDNNNGGRIDPSVAISFIVLVPMKRSTKSNNNALPDFGSFHEFFIDLEDRLLDECDDYWDLIDATEEHDNSKNNNKSDGDKNNKNNEETTNNNNKVPNVNSLGCEITIAAFHPKWQFNGGGGGSNSQSDGDAAAIDYEKRTPYPTISIVMSSVIDSLLKEREDGDGTTNEDDNGGGDGSSALATERIADLNEKTLCAIGVERLKEIFDEEVLGCPMKGHS